MRTRSHTTTARWRNLRWATPLAAALSLMAINACDAGDGQIGNGPAGNPPLCAESKTDEVRLRLAPHCEACHGPGANLPFFASLQAFEDLLAYNPKYVVANAPQQSSLLQLLAGEGEGNFRQMPISGPSFASLAAAGETDISMAELEQWIGELPDKPINRAPDAQAITTRRLSADEISDSLLAQLGLSFDADFVQGYGQNAQSPTIILKGSLPVYSSDAAPAMHYPNEDSANERYVALGGPSWLQRRPQSTDITPTFLQTLVQLSQAWCQMAVDKPDNGALFRHASAEMSSDDDAQAIQDNIAYLHLRMLGEPATAERVQSLYQQTFVTHRAQGGRAAWTALCARLVRDPLWLSL